MAAPSISIPQRAESPVPLRIAFAIFIAMAVPVGILNVAWVYIYLDMAQPFDALGVLLLFGTMGRLTSTFISGRLIARFGLWRCVFGGMSLTIIGLIGYLISPSWLFLLLMVFSVAFGWGVMDIGINLYTASHYRPGVLNFLHASYGVGLTLGPLIATFMVVTLGQNWRWSYLPPLVVMLGLWLWTYLSRALWALPDDDRTSRTRKDVALPAIGDGETDALELSASPLLQGVEVSPNPTSPSTDAPRGASIRATLGLPLMGAWLLMALTYGGFEAGTGQLSNSLLTEARGLDPAVASTWISLYWAMFTVGRFATGFIVGRLSEHTLLFGCAIVSTLGAVLVALPNSELTLPGLLLIGVGLAAVFPAMISAVPGRFGPVHAPNAVGFTIGIASAGTAVLPGLGAFIAARIGFASLGPFMVVMGLALLASYALVLRRGRVG